LQERPDPAIWTRSFHRSLLVINQLSKFFIF
jgi:hypothetical protein